MLEFWYREKRTLVDFRRGPLGPYFDRFAAHLKDHRYSVGAATEILGKCCQFNAFLIENKIMQADNITETEVDSFLELYLVQTRTACLYSPRYVARNALNRLLDYLIQIKVRQPPKPKRVKRPYGWLLDRYLQHLQEECEFSKVTLQRCRAQVGSFLEALRLKARPNHFKTLSAEAVEGYVKQHLKDSPENLSALAAALRRFFRFCAIHQHTRMDFSGLIPPVRRYRHASLPKGMEDSALERVLGAIDKNTPTGARDYAIMVLMMAYGLRGVSVAELLLDDLDWQRSQIRIRAQKGGKEVVLPLMDTVGDALIGYPRKESQSTRIGHAVYTEKSGWVDLSGPPVLYSTEPDEINSVEDPKIYRAGDTYYLFYNAVWKPDPQFSAQVRQGYRDWGIFVVTKLATSKDLVHFEKKGQVVPYLVSKGWSKSAVIPRSPQGEAVKINGKYLMFLSEGCGDKQFIGYSEDLLNWEFRQQTFLTLPQEKGRVVEVACCVANFDPDGKSFILDTFCIDRNQRYWAIQALYSVTDPAKPLATEKGGSLAWGGLLKYRGDWIVAQGWDSPKDRQDMYFYSYSGVVSSSGGQALSH